MQFKGVIDRDERSGKASYQIQHSMDAYPVIEHALKLRALEAEHLNKKNEIRPQATLPMTEVMNIRQKYGIDPLNVKPDQEKRFWNILQSEYPKFLTTNKRVYRAPKPKIRFQPGTL